MPRSVLKADKLGYPTFTVNQGMGRNLEARNRFKIRMLAGIKLVAEELLDLTAAKLSRRQTDVMDHQKRDVGALGTGTKIGRRAPPRIRNNSGISHGANGCI